MSMSKSGSHNPINLSGDARIEEGVDRVNEKYANLDGRSYFGFALIFLLLPVACVVVSSVLYYVWRSERPNKAKQINML